MDYKRLSKEISYALRHAPWEYNLELDCQGYVSIDKFLLELNRRRKREREIVYSDIEEVIKQSTKQRLEIVDNKIRALYGHTGIQVKKVIEIPPKFLYHGTTHKAINDIKEKGLLPMQRQFVHLSIDIQTATEVGTRRDGNPIILKIDTQKAINDGINFYKGNEQIWLCDSLPSKYFEIIKG